jgi:uncharacterized repeat protein (TIGR03803 family)
MVAVIAALAASLAPACGQFAYQRLKSFGFADLICACPMGGLVEGTNGALYGMSDGGGEAEQGTVFCINKDGSGFTVLWSFSGTNGDGAIPDTGLCLAANGSLYGATGSGGTSNQGTLFRIDQDGSNYAVLRSFTGLGGDGAGYGGSLIQAGDGLLYGTTSQGGDQNLGTVFCLQLDGSGYRVLKSFAGSPEDGANPTLAGVVQGADGRLYGTTQAGGSNNMGTVFSLNPDGSAYEVLRSLTGAKGDGARPQTALVQGGDGMFYGTTYAGGSANKGTLFRLQPDGSGYAVILQFNGSDGANPSASLIFGTNGVLYGTTTRGGAGDNGAVFRINPDGSGYQGLKSYQALGEDGSDPVGSLTQGSDGEIYGTTFSGGNQGMGSLGTVFRLDPEGAGYTVLRNLLMTGGDGQNPYDALVEATDGCLYGTTQNGGDYDLGAVFKMNKDGTGYEVLHSFAGTNGPGPSSDGASPSAGLVQGADGVLYGTTSCDDLYEGGDQSESFINVVGNGTVFRLELDGSGYQVLKHFTGGLDGSCPYGGLIQATDGMLYGTTFNGGAGEGTVFRLNPDGSGYAVIKSLGGTNGNFPQTGLLQGSDGRLYGTTQSGGPLSGGALFAMELDGTGIQVLKAFGGTNGNSPQAGLMRGLDGALYGTTLMGGLYGGGTIFKVNADGTGFAVLKQFKSGAGDGDSPKAVLVQGKDGTLYGTTFGGGTSSGGTVFQLNPDGSGYQVLHNFIQNFYDGILPQAGLLLASDGGLYGTTSAGARDQNGSIYCLLPQAVMAPPTLALDGCHLLLSGVAGRTYTIQRSGSVSGPWIGIATAATGPNGVGELVDTNPPSGAAFYRASFP